jgi:plastocyanin
LKTRVSALARLALAAGVATLVVVGVACGSDDSNDSTNNSSSSTANATVDASGAITIVAKDNVYEPKEFTGPAGQNITVTLDNEGAAIHDFVIKDQKGAEGKEIQTGLINAGKTGNVAFSLPAETYDFYCAVHPVEMRGRFTLQ